MIFMQNLVWGILAPFIILCTLAPLASLVCTLKFQNLPVSKNLASLAVLLLMCFGMSLSMLRGIGRAVSAKRPLEWIRTPKYAEIKNKKDWSKDKDQVPFDMLWIWELLFVMLGLWAILSAIQHKNFSGLFHPGPFYHELCLRASVFGSAEPPGQRLIIWLIQLLLKKAAIG